MGGFFQNAASHWWMILLFGSFGLILVTAIVIYLIRLFTDVFGPQDRLRKPEPPNIWDQGGSGGGGAV
ncbi:hypothetical protein [Humidisolicoccus flavus]|uniref:hypothetical protein n=1 Tax=Humidisolicoccus flavus TaxID=3111414 RepID=UPI00324DA176